MGPLARDNADPSHRATICQPITPGPKASDGALPVVIVVQEILAYMNTFPRYLPTTGAEAISLSRAAGAYFREGDPNDFADIPTLLSGWY
ncbi:hypothetical protein KCP76_10215 [Salmonella enterica subsp. enterica serovar Weltevreden]|nr:hypothetical protein KCP76_10215 [Salmonella enterica subsp. enterica serovar Weltevreden]